MYKKMLIVVFFTLFFVLSVKAEEKLIFAVDLVRHGDRTPLIQLPNAPYNCKEGLGELTVEGMKQEFQLGKQLRKKYVDYYHLLPSHYIANTMYVRSSDFNRTLMSAESLLLGLYPLGTGPISVSGYQPIPVHTVPVNQDNLLVSNNSENIFKSLLNQYIYAKIEWKTLTHEHANDIKRWQQASGLPVNNLKQLRLLSDNLYIRQLHHISLPKGISIEDEKTIDKLGSMTIFKHINRTCHLGQVFIATVYKYFQQATKSKLKYVLFMAHDGTIMCVLSKLGVMLKNTPGYGADLNISLFENDKNYHVKVTLNDQLVFIPYCGGNSCTLEQFAKLAKK